MKTHTLNENINFKKVVSLAEVAGQLIMKFYNKGGFEIKRKSDNSPVTEADLAASELIINELKSITPMIPVVSEELPAEVNLKLIKNAKLFWLIDPIDGTWSFIKRKGKFTVNIALIEDGIPIFGVIYSPLDEINYYSDLSGNAFKSYNKIVEKILPNKEFKGGYNFLVSNQNLDQRTQDFINNFEVKTITPIPSSIKFALIADAQGDIYPRFKITCIWDTAAGHALLKCIGGEIYDLNNRPLTYNRQLENPDFIAVASKEIKLFNFL